MLSDTVALEMRAYLLVLRWLWASIHQSWCFVASSDHSDAKLSSRKVVDIRSAETPYLLLKKVITSALKVGKKHLEDRAFVDQGKGLGQAASVSCSTSPAACVHFST